MFIIKHIEDSTYYVANRAKTRGIKHYPDTKEAREEESCYVEEFDQMARPLDGEPDDYTIVREAYYGDEF